MPASRPFLPLLAVLVAASMAFAQPQPPYPISDHYDGQRFLNPGYGRIDKPWRDLLKWRMEGRTPWPDWVETSTGPAAPPRDGRGVAATFVNHATFVLRFSGKTSGEIVNVLADPIWSERCSPVSFAGPKRVHAPGVVFDSLPRIHVVVISHNHYDHLDLPTLRMIAARDSALFLVPLGDRKLLEGAGIANVEELDWWQTRRVRGLEATLLPAQHWSARGINDRNLSLWGSWGITGPDGTRVYHGGDTGYGPHFSDIGTRWGAPDLALLPIGAYAPRWFMSAAHMDPHEAVRAFHDLRARKAVGMHFGTFQLTSEGRDEPAALTEKAAQGLAFHVPEVGQAFFALRAAAAPVPADRTSGAAVPKPSGSTTR